MIWFFRFGPLSFVELDSQKAIDLPKLFDLPVVSSLAQKYSKTAAQILLRWATQRGLAVIPKTSDPKRLIENLDCNSFDLTPNEMKAISALNKNIRFNNPVDVRTVIHFPAWCRVNLLSQVCWHTLYLRMTEGRPRNKVQIAVLQRTSGSVYY